MDGFHAVVTGRVQGVGFRWFVQQAAVRLGVRGTVRNMRDGSVEVWAVGDQKALMVLAGELERGPLHGCVEHVTLVWSAPARDWDDFSITV